MKPTIVLILSALTLSGLVLGPAVMAAEPN